MYVRINLKIGEQPVHKCSLCYIGYSWYHSIHVDTLECMTNWCNYVHKLCKKKKKVNAIFANTVVFSTQYRTCVLSEKNISALH